MKCEFILRKCQYFELHFDLEMKGCCQVDGSATGWQAAASDTEGEWRETTQGCLFFFYIFEKKVFEKWLNNYTVHSKFQTQKSALERQPIEAEDEKLETIRQRRRDTAGCSCGAGAGCDPFSCECSRAGITCQVRAVSGQKRARYELGEHASLAWSVSVSKDLFFIIKSKFSKIDNVALILIFALLFFVSVEYYRLGCLEQGLYF